MADWSVSGNDGDMSMVRTNSNRMSDWTSLEIAKLLVPVAASVVLALIGLRLSEDIESFKSTAERYSKSIDVLIQKRLALYDEIGSKMNDIFVYYMYIGKWKKLSPADIINDKQDVDEIIYRYEPFFFQRIYR